jgi:hypothetical protein
MLRPSPARSGVQRWLVLTAISVVAMQCLGVAHLALAPHGFCWEHGLVTELEQLPGAQAQPPAPRPGLDSGGAFVRSDEHPHCAAANLRRAAPRPAPAPVGLLTQIWEEQPRPPGVPANPSRRASIQRAPKQSPPS